MLHSTTEMSRRMNPTVFICGRGLKLRAVEDQMWDKKKLLMNNSIISGISTGHCT